MNSLRLGFIGDLALNVDIEDMYGNRPSDLFDDCRDLLKKCDAVVANYECAVLPDKCIYNLKEKGKLRGTGMLIPELREMNISLVNLANNHVMDCGVAGLEVLTTKLRLYNIECFGAGENRSQASRMHTVTIKGTKIGICGFCDDTQSYAKKHEFGVSPLRAGLIKNTIIEYSGRLDFIIVSLHSDLEFYRSPSTWRVRLSRKCIDWGANLVIQHHPHVIQGKEEYGEGRICYSLGNFIFPVQNNEYMQGYSGTNEAVLEIFDIKFDNKKLVEIDNSSHYFRLRNNSPKQIDHDLPLFRSYITKLDDRIKSYTTIRENWYKQAKADLFSTLYNAFKLWSTQQKGCAIRLLLRILTHGNYRRSLIGWATKGHF